jgi:hypothetical protein
MSAGRWPLQQDRNGLEDQKLKTEAKLQVALYFQTFTFRITKFQKILKQILEEVNDEY